MRIHGVADLGKGFLDGIGQDSESGLCVDSGFSLVVKLCGESLGLLCCRGDWSFSFFYPGRRWLLSAYDLGTVGALDDVGRVFPYPWVVKNRLQCVKLGLVES